jgi:hypothetical protein
MASEEIRGRGKLLNIGDLSFGARKLEHIALAERTSEPSPARLQVDLKTASKRRAFQACRSDNATISLRSAEFPGDRRDGVVTYRPLFQSEVVLVLSLLHLAILKILTWGRIRE